MKYKLDFKKYRKSDVEKYKNISNKILQSERADLIDMSPDFDFCMFLMGEATGIQLKTFYQITD